MRDRLLVVTGSRALYDTSSAMQWARSRIGPVIHRWAPLLVVNGGALGPDQWSSNIACTLGLAAREFVVRGDVIAYGHLRRELEVPERWLPQGLLGRDPIARNAAMIDFVVKHSKQHGLEVLVLALSAPWATTHGTRNTIRLAREAGMRVIERACPEWRGPDRG